MYADVLIQYGVKILDKTFTYKIPSTLNVKKGQKVKILFGGIEIYGIVINIKDITDIENPNEILNIINPEISLNEELLELGKYLSKITLCTLIKSYQTMLPSSLKVKKIDTNYNKYDEYLELNQDIEIIKEYIKTNKKCKSQISILERLMNNEKIINKLRL